MKLHYLRTNKVPVLINAHNRAQINSVTSWEKIHSSFKHCLECPPGQNQQITQPKAIPGLRVKLLNIKLTVLHGKVSHLELVKEYHTHPPTAVLAMIISLRIASQDCICSLLCTQEFYLGCFGKKGVNLQRDWYFRCKTHIICNKEVSQIHLVSQRS